MFWYIIIFRINPSFNGPQGFFQLLQLQRKQLKVSCNYFNERLQLHFLADNYVALVAAHSEQEADIHSLSHMKL